VYVSLQRHDDLRRLSVWSLAHLRGACELLPQWACVAAASCAADGVCADASASVQQEAARAALYSDVNVLDVALHWWFPCVVLSLWLLRLVVHHGVVGAVAPLCACAAGCAVLVAWAVFVTPGSAATDDALPRAVVLYLCPPLWLAATLTLVLLWV
jgi:hypothetical protein